MQCSVEWQRQQVTVPVLQWLFYLRLLVMLVDERTVAASPEKSKWDHVYMLRLSCVFP
jgi:hypothetical protein